MFCEFNCLDVPGANRKVVPQFETVKRVTSNFYEAAQEQVLEKAVDNANSTNLEPDKSEATLASQEVKCYVCFTSPSSMLYADCMHGGICNQCCLAVLRNDRKCSLCRRPIASIMELQPLRGNIFKVLSQVVLLNDIRG